MTGDYMDHSSVDVGEASDCNIEEYEEKAYEELKGGKLQINLPTNTFACPYCSNNTSRDYQYKELLQHATIVGKTDSNTRSKRERGSHLALAKYLEKYLTTEACGQSQPKCDVGCLKNHDGDEMFVWPWKVIVANLPTRSRFGIHFRPSETDIREHLATGGFHPKKVHTLFNGINPSRFAVIDFGKNWLGFYNAIRFDKAHEVDHHGKKDWNSENGSKSGIYGWVARGDDYTSINEYGEHLRNSAVLTLSDIIAEEHSKQYKLKKNLTKISEERKRKYEETERNYMETKNILNKLIAEKDLIHQSHNEDMRKMNVLELENAKLKTELESQLCKTHALAQENEKLKEEITFQQKELEQRAKERDERKSQIAQDISDSCSSMSARIKELEEKVTELEEELQYKDSLNQTLINREHDSNKELQDARKELINALSQFMEVPTIIGLKRMGEVVSRPFQYVCFRRFSSQDWSLKSVEITSLWQERVNNPQWHPFKPIFKDGKLQETVDEDDSHMKELRSQWGEEAYDAVANALLEMNEHNTSGRYVESVLWNFREGRKANLKEVIVSLINQLKAAKSVKRRTGQQQN